MFSRTKQAAASRHDLAQTQVAPRILLAVTVDQSLRLLRGQPQYLASRGWDVYVVSAGDSGIHPEAIAGPSPDVTFLQVPMTRDPNPVQDLKSLRNWVAMLRTVRPDVVCVGTPKAGLLGLVAARVLGVRGRIYLLRGLRYETEQGLKRAILRTIERFAISQSTHAVAVSPSMRSELVTSGLDSRERVQVLGSGSSNGVEVPSQERLTELKSDRATARLAQGLKPGVPVLGFMGRLTPDKDPLGLVEACALLAKRGIPLQVLLVGSREVAEYADRVEARLKDSGLHYVATGHTDDPQRLMSMVDVFCLPSHREGFPNVCLEAASLSIPVVTTNATGNIDSVVDGVTGYSVPVGDVDKLADRLQILLQDQNARARMGAAGRDRTLREFSRPDVWRQYEELYSTVLAETESKSGTRRVS